MKEIKITGCIELQPELTLDEFEKQFIEFIESKGWFFGGSFKEIVDGYYINADGTKGADNQVSDFELMIWLRNNLKEGVLVCDALSEIDVELPTDFTQLSDQQIIDVCKALNEDSCIGETLRRDLKPILDGYNNAMQTILKEGVDMQIITAVKIAEALGGKKLDTKS